MNKLQIDINESGYSIVDASKMVKLIEGIQSFSTACELHEMLTGELQDI